MAPINYGVIACTNADSDAEEYDKRWIHVSRSWGKTYTKKKNVFTGKILLHKIWLYF